MGAMIVVTFADGSVVVTDRKAMVADKALLFGIGEYIVKAVVGE